VVSVLRFLWHAWQRALDAIFGPQRRQLNRLVKAGRVRVGVHTAEYAIPTIKTYIFDDTTLEIGDYCSIAQDCVIHLGGQHGIRTVSTYPHKILWQMEGAGQDGHPDRSREPRIVIGADCYIGDRSMIMTGVRIGHGAVIGSNAIVTKDVPDYAIMGGVPAKVIGYRHPEDQRRELLEIAWWEWPEAEVRAAADYLGSDDVGAFIEYAHTRFPDGYPRRGPGER